MFFRWKFELQRPLAATNPCGVCAPPFKRASCYCVVHSSCHLTHATLSAHLLLLPPNQPTNMLVQPQSFVLPPLPSSSPSMEYYFKEEVKKDNHRHSTVSFLPLPPSFAAAAAVPVTDSTATDKIHPLLAHYSAFMQKKDIGGGSASLLWAQVSNQADFIRATPYWVRFVKYVYDTIDSKVWMIVLVTCIVILTYPLGRFFSSRHQHEEEATRKSRWTVALLFCLAPSCMR